MTKAKIYPFLVVTVFITITVLLILGGRSHTLADVKGVKVAGRSVKVELALTPAAQTQGLSGRAGLSEDTGMLFVFAQPGKYYFWMKDMNFAIDMIWIGEDMKVIYIKKDARPAQYPDTYGPDQDAKYVLEVVSGFSDTYNLNPGDVVRFTY
jgi:uncharacterized membrane protein (UPF0127 family)